MNVEARMTKCPRAIESFEDLLVTNSLIDRRMGTKE
jgi:hypothetical protein